MLLWLLEQVGDEKKLKIEETEKRRNILAISPKSQPHTRPAPP